MSKKPFHQKLYELIAALFIGIGSFGTILGSINDAAEIFNNLRVAIWTTVFFIVSVVSIYLWIRYLKPKRENEVGGPTKVVRINKKVYLGVAGAVLLIWIGKLWTTNKTASSPQTATYVKNVPAVDSSFTRPIFNANDKRFKILIFPWKQQGSYQNKMYYIGPLLKELFEALSKQEKVNLVVEYMGDSVELGDLAREEVDSIMKYHNADHVLYGSYAFKETEGSSTDKICFNYQTYYSDWSPTPIHSRTDNEMVDFHGQSDLRRGSGYEEVNYILYWSMALAEVKGKRFAQAIERLHKIPEYEKKEQILFQLGNCYYFMQDYANARISNEKVLKLKPEFTEAAIHVAVALANEHKYEAAKKRLEAVLKDDEGNTEALRNLGLLYKVTGDTAAAIICFEKILQGTAPVTERDWAVAGIIYEDKGDYVKAASCYKKSLDIHAKHPDRWSRLATVYCHLKDTSKAEDALLLALALDSTYAPAWYRMGMLSIHKKTPHKAQLYLGKAVQFNPSNGEAWAALGLNSYFSGQTERAKSYLNRAYMLNPNAHSTLYWSFFVYNHLKDYSKAKHFLENLLTINPDEVKLWNELGVVNSHLDNYSEAILCFKRTLQGLPDNGAVYYSIASISSSRHYKQDALNYLSRAITLEPTMKQVVQRDKNFDWLRNKKEFLAILQ